MSEALVGKRAVVTGASKGIGRAIALAFAAQGAEVLVTARSTDLLAQLVDEITAAGGRASAYTCDVTNEEQVHETGSAILAAGGIDVLVNNAGGNSFSAPLVAMRPTGWAKTMNLNLTSTFTWLQVVMPAMVKARTGSVINVSSIAGLAGMPLMAHYGAAKAAVLSLTKSAALECAADGVRVNAIVPGWVETDLTDFLRASDQVEASVLSRVPMQRWGQPHEIAAGAVFLASDASSFMTGQALVLDGGLSVMP